ncbi:MAG: hypothetical protein Q8T09_04705 [Candidatus Melainabacteria bacterium]|nr:hypothetical protein [Candidatus Melainabacteria bacterium]
MNNKNTRNLLALLGTYSLIFICCLLLAWYAISGGTFRAIFFILQGYTSHFAAQAFASAGLNSNAISLQESSISAYQQSNANLPCEPLKALECDEIRHLTNMHLKWKNRTEALAAAKRFEDIVRRQVNTETPHSDRWKCSLSEILLFQARILNNDNLRKEAIAKYRESITINQALTDENHTNTGTESQLSAARKELSELTKDQ